MDINKLNEKQKEAVLHTEGPLLVLAGAGSGKTRVLTYKVAYLIKEKKVKPDHILAITFTNKAAVEMKERIIALIGDSAFEMQISTFHSFGVKIIRKYGAILGYKSNFTILDANDSLSVIKKILKELNLDLEHYNPNVIKNKISSAKNELLEPDSYEKYATTPFEKTVIKVYKKYEDKLFYSNSLDFDDLLFLPIKLFKIKPDILEYYQQRYHYVLIDEYQDTNEAQYILSKMISAKHKNICVVGDMDQTIYGFRGSNYHNIMNFEKDYEQAKVILLEENYRSTKTILEAANNVIKNNKYRKKKNLWSQNEKGTKIRYYRALSEEDEAHYVIKEINEVCQKEQIPYNEVAILYRTHAQSRIIEETFLKSGIPFKVVGGFHFYERKEIKDLIAYLKLIYNEKDNVSLLRIINEPRRGIGEVAINKLMAVSEAKKSSLYEAIELGKELEFKNLIENLKESSLTLSLTELIEEVLTKSGMKKELEKVKTLEAEMRLENLAEFKSITMSLEARGKVITLEDFLMELALVTDIGEYKENKEQVNLMTMHAVKGLEFAIVFIIGLEEGILPHMNSFINSNELEEERRLCYVAITRAKKRLYFINAKRRTLYGRRQINPPSRFIDEVGGEYLDIDFKEIELTKEEESKEDIYNSDIVYNISDRVRHKDYGEGIVLGIKDEILTIAFGFPYDIKMIMRKHRNLSKI